LRKVKTKRTKISKLGRRVNVNFFQRNKSLGNNTTLSLIETISVDTASLITCNSKYIYGTVFLSQVHKLDS